MKPPWQVELEKHLGDSEANDLAEILGWIKETDGNTHREAWCADSLNHFLKFTGFKGTGSPAAASFLNWGVDILVTPLKTAVSWFSSGPAGRTQEVIMSPRT